VRMRRFESPAGCPVHGDAVHDQHLVSKVVLKRFTDPSTGLELYRSPRTQVAGVPGLVPLERMT
jgi:hypothetical protein